MVRTCSGLKDIASIRPNDIILSFDIESYSLVERRVTKIFEYSSGEIIIFYFGEHKFHSTPSHTVLTLGGWKRAKHITVGDQILINQENMWIWHKIDGLEKIPATASVFNLTTVGEHNFIADGVIVHNFSFMRKFRTFLHAFLFDRIYTLSHPEDGANSQRGGINLVTG